MKKTSKDQKARQVRIARKNEKKAIQRKNALKGRKAPPAALCYTFYDNVTADDGTVSKKCIAKCAPNQKSLVQALDSINKSFPNTKSISVFIVLDDGTEIDVTPKE
jgi:hypothetical protein